MCTLPQPPPPTTPPSKPAPTKHPLPFDPRSPTHPPCPHPLLRSPHPWRFARIPGFQQMFSRLRSGPMVTKMSSLVVPLDFLPSAQSSCCTSPCLASCSVGWRAGGGSLSDGLARCSAKGSGCADSMAKSDGFCGSPDDDASAFVLMGSQPQLVANRHRSDGGLEAHLCCCSGASRRQGRPALVRGPGHSVASAKRTWFLHFLGCFVTAAAHW